MTNYNIKLDLSKLCKTTTMDIQGKTGKVKCVVIPVEENGIFLSDKTGNIYLDFTAYERKEESFGQTHFIKQRVGGAKWKAMTDEERKNIPICGSLAPTSHSDNGYQDNTPQPSTSQSSSSFGSYNTPNNNDIDLPF